MAVSSARVWVSIAVAAVIFGTVIFAATREYYRQNPGALGVTADPPAHIESDSTPKPASANPAGARLNAADVASLQDPADISRQADAFFANGQYAQAVAGYQRLLLFSPGSVDIYNNLGLTQHYTGKSSEALATLRTGIAIDADNQRIWLTLGFVNGQLGNVVEAREAFEKTISIGGDESISDSARKMLAELP